MKWSLSSFHLKETKTERFSESDNPLLKEECFVRYLVYPRRFLLISDYCAILYI